MSPYFYFPLLPSLSVKSRKSSVRNSQIRSLRKDLDKQGMFRPYTAIFHFRQCPSHLDSLFLYL